MKKYNYNDVVAMIFCEILLSDNYEYDTNCLDWTYIQKIVYDYLTREMCLRSGLWYNNTKADFLTASLMVNFLVDEINQIKNYLLSITANYEIKDNQIIFTEIKVMPIEWHD